MKLTARFIALILSVLLCLTVLASCGTEVDLGDLYNTLSSDIGEENNGTTKPQNTGNPGSQNPQPNPQSTNPPTSVTTKNPAEVLGVEQTDFKGAEVYILQRTEYVPEINGVENSTSLVSKTVYDRNRAVEEYLGVELGFDHESATHETYLAKNGFKSKLDAAATAGEAPYHIIADYSYLAAVNNIGGWETNRYLDLNQIPENDNFLSLDKVWWNQSYPNESVIAQQHYFLVGDITTSAIEGLEVMFFNDALVEQFLEEDAASMLKRIETKTWTYQFFLDSLTKIGEAEKTQQTLFGASLARDSSSIDGFLRALGSEIVARDSRGGAEPIFYSRQNLTLGSTLRALYQNNENVYAYDSAVAGGDTAAACFAKQESVFYGGTLGSLKGLVGTGMDYTAIPMPILGESVEDESYVVSPQPGYSVLGIPVNVTTSLDVITATLEVMAAKSYETVRPAIFEECFHTQYQAASPKAQMFQKMVAEAKFDYGHVFAEAMNNPLGIIRSFIQIPEESAGYIADLDAALGEISSDSKTSLKKFIEKFYEEAPSE